MEEDSIEEVEGEVPSDATGETIKKIKEEYIMQVISKNPCTRCGTQRIVLKVSKEKIGNSFVTTTETVCPNKDCQKRVESDNKKQRDRVEALREKSRQRAMNRHRAFAQTK